MKNLIAVFTLLSIVTMNDLSAQKQLKEKNLIGVWKMVINIEEGFKEAKEELENEDDSFIGNLILGSVEGLVTSVLEEVDIFMHFQQGGDLKIIIEAFEEKEVEYSKWLINKEGKLIIEDNDNTDVDHWLLEDGLLVGYDDEGNKNFTYMVKID